MSSETRIEREFASDLEELNPLWTTQKDQSRLVYLGVFKDEDWYLVVQLDGSIWRLTNDEVRRYVVEKMLSAGVKVLSREVWREQYVAIMERLANRNESEATKS